jgi:hypothetical protein
MIAEDRTRLAMQSKLELPATTAAIEDLAAHITKLWAEAPDTATREHLWFRLKGLRDIEQMLIAAAAGADVAEYVSALEQQGF